MRITGIHTRVEAIELTRPYAIALRRVDDVQMSFVELSSDDGLTGIGCASPEALVTGETREACSAALQEDALSWLVGRDARSLPALCRELDAHLPEQVRARLAADETLLDARDALTLIEPPRACGIFNIKLMKCGGVHAARRIADIADSAGIELMWGCMDESIVSISAALHAALASPATRYLDLDGSLDLARDLVEGGFILEDGYMRTTELPGLGVRRV
jgi:L-alanine-DL-glutamate epimerase-like enolase superfamily enzyme